MKKVILIPGYSMGENSFGVGKTYLTFASRFGTPRILMPQEEMVQGDLLLLPGGMDINPASYGAVPEFFTGNTDVMKQFFYDHRLKNYVDSNIPIFGICLGFQQLAAFFGAKLTQNLPNHEQSRVGEACHKIHVVNQHLPEFRVAKLDVNSRHHQGLLHTGIDGNPNLEPLYYSDNEDNKNNGIVEVMRHKEKPIFGVQYHPEELNDTLSTRIMDKLLSNG